MSLRDGYGYRDAMQCTARCLPRHAWIGRSDHGEPGYVIVQKVPMYVPQGSRRDILRVEYLISNKIIRTQTDTSDPRYMIPRASVVRSAKYTATMVGNHHGEFGGDAEKICSVHKHQRLYHASVWTA